MQVPEVRRQFAHAGVEEVDILQHLVVEIVLGGEPQRTRLDAHVDVFGHQDDLPLRLLPLQGHHHADDVIVRLAQGERLGKRAVQRLGLQEQLARGGIRRVALERDARVDLAGDAADDFVEVAARLARVARDFRQAFLVAVEFLQRHDRQEHVVLLEAEQAGGIVHQHVGVEHEQFGQ